MYLGNDNVILYVFTPQKEHIFLLANGGYLNLNQCAIKKKEVIFVFNYMEL